jgi:hypothetical protein
MANPVTLLTSSSGGLRPASLGTYYMSSVVDSDFFTFTNFM